MLSHVCFFVIPWTVDLGASWSKAFSRQDIGVGSYSLLQGDLPDPGIKHRSPALQADSLLSELPGNMDD